MATSNYSSRSSYTDKLNNIIKPLLHTNVELFNIDVAKNYIDKQAYVDTLNQQLTNFPDSENTTLTLAPLVVENNGAVYKHWKCQPFALVFDWFPGLTKINGWPIEVILQMSIYSDLHQAEGILPFCSNVSLEDSVYWDGCKTYSKSGIATWQINKSSVKYPANWLGIYFSENAGASHNYEGKDKLEYWIEKWNSGYIPKICIFGLIDCNGTPIFNPKSATDEIQITIANESIPQVIQNFHYDAYSSCLTCPAVKRYIKVAVSEEILQDNDSYLPTTLNYSSGELPLPFPGQHVIKINQDTETTWLSFDNSKTWYIYVSSNNYFDGPYSSPYNGNFTKDDSDPDNVIWINPLL